MAAYLVVVSTITDEEQFGIYRDAVMPLIVKFGGKHVRGGPADLLEGASEGRSIALFEFQTMDAINSFWSAPEYVPVKKLRQGAAKLDVWAVPGLM